MSEPRHRRDLIADLNRKLLFTDARYLEDQLADALGEDADVDGHDIGSGQTNLFIFTSDPSATFQEAKPVLQKAKMLKSLTAAFRDMDGEDYTVIWPSGSKRKFEVI